MHRCKEETRHVDFQPRPTGDIKDILPKTGLNKAFRQPRAHQMRMAVDGLWCELDGDIPTGRQDLKADISPGDHCILGGLYFRGLTSQGRELAK